MNYDTALRQAVARRQARLCAEAENYAIATSPIRYAPSEVHEARLAMENHYLSSQLCPHGKVPRLIAEKMGMPRLACNRCA